jgi:hypothetical protein
VAHGAADGVACVEVEREVGAWIAAIIPAIDFGLVCAEGGGDGFFGGGAIGPGGGGGDVALAFKAFAELVVGAADVFVECVAAALFVASEVVAIAGSVAIVGTTWLRVS